MVELRGGILFLILLCLRDAAQARHLHGRSPYAVAHHERLSQRQTNIEPPRCPPRSAAGKLPGLKDDYNVPDATLEQIDKDNLAAYLQFSKGEGPFIAFAEAGAIGAAAGSVEGNATETSTELEEPKAEEGPEASAVPAEDTDPETSSEPESNVRRFGRRQIDIRPGALRHAAAQVKVPTNGGDAILYTAAGTMYGPVQDRIISTQDLCGCTVFVISSPFATLMLHVLERRGDEFAFQGPGSTVGGLSQAVMDGAFVGKGRELLIEAMRGFGTTIASFREWFPLDKTTVAVVTPKANPDYLDWDFWKRREDNPEVPPQQSIYMTEELYQSLGYGAWPAGLESFWWPLSGTAQNPVSTHPIIAGSANPDRLVYPSAAKALLAAINELVIPGRSGQSEIFTYRRRYSNDPDHKNKVDDREFVAVVPYVTAQGTVVPIMYYDDDKFTILNRL